MKKALLPLIIASVLPTAAFAEVVVYGKANVAVQHTDKNSSDEAYTEVVSNASRIGLKGSEVINDDLKAIYQFEYETKVDDGTNKDAAPDANDDLGPFTQRNIYVGLQGVGGTGMIGMFDTPLKVAQEKVDLFNDLVGDLKTVLEGEVRAKNVVQYATPSFANFTATVAYVNTEQDKTNSTDGASASFAYATKELYLAVAADINSANASSKATPANDTEIARAVARVTVGPVVLGAMYETYDNGTIDEDGYLASAQWNINSEWAVKGQYVQSDMIYDGNTSASIGGDYKISKATKLFAYATKVEDDRVAPTNVDNTYVGVGIELNF